jgi:Domain of unknown function (DUF4129)
VRRFRAPRRLALSLLFVPLWASVTFAIPLREYRQHVKVAIDALDLLNEDEEGQTETQRALSLSSSVHTAREAMPRSLKVEWDGATIDVDNSWLDDDLRQIEKQSSSGADGAFVLDRVLERLKAVQDRLLEIEQQPADAVSKAEMNSRLAAILLRPEYARAAKPDRKQSALARWLQKLGELLVRFFRWFRNLFPQPREVNASGMNTIAVVAKLFVVLLALGLLAFAVKTLAPRFLRNRKAVKKSKPRARIVLGERLEPDQSAADILADAEALARSGDLRGAIRKGYIALLVELGDRKIISLAQYKTNRDYLRAVREVERLHPKMEQLTYSFERHWYGLVQASDTDWSTFRAGFRDTLASI